MGAVLIAAGLGEAAAQDIPVPRPARAVLRLDTLRLRPPLPYSLQVPREDAARRALQWELGVRRMLAARGEERWRALRLGDSAVIRRLGAPQQLIAAGPIIFPQDEQPERRGLLIQQYADLGLELNAVLELRLERLRNLHCTASDLTSLSLGCRDAFNPPRVDAQFDVRGGGVVGQRLHVNLDYDTQREFDASNNIQVYYQGLEDEILRRVEVGNISFSPPRSRFIAGGIPTNNFGVMVEAQVGALDFSAIYAQQKGNVVRARTFAVGDQTVLPVDRLIADRDFEPQRFFFVVNPRLLAGYPDVDVLDLDATALPDALRPTEVRIYRHRSTLGRPAGEANLSGIQAVALRSDSPQRQGPINWEVMVEGRDYYLDPSGAWFAMAQRLDQEDFLAVSYITAAGDTVGTFPSVSVSGRSDTLELIMVPRSTPDLPTFYYEMRQVYRVGAVDDVARSSIAVDLLVGGSSRPDAGAATFLAQLGLALPNDATRFDEYNRLWPRQRDPGNGLPLRELYVVFPHLTPFADTVRLANPAFRTDSLYRTPTYDLRVRGPAPLFEIGLHYDARGGDGSGSLQLGGFQIREGSERVMAGNRSLVRNVDYTINYEIGQLTFVRPDSLFRQPTQVTVQFEENGAFAVAPTNIMGFQGRYDFGERGSLHGVALSQRQRTTFTRPPLGFEPASSLVAGVTGEFRFRPLRLTRLLDALPLVNTQAPSAITLDAEMVTSRPSPNQLGVAYLETFESEGGTFLSLSQDAWEFGSRPSSPRGIPAVDPIGFLDADATLLTWQNLIPATNGQVVQLRAQDIDPTIRVVGTGQQAETILWGALHPDTIGGLLNPNTFQHRWFLPHSDGPRWRSIVQPFSASGVDLSRIEFLEFWVLEDPDFRARNAGLTLAFDFGTVFEDAVGFQPQSFDPSGADTVYAGRRRAGEGRLDTERDLLTASFNAATDDLGILGDVADSIFNTASGEFVDSLPLCRSALATTLEVYSWGSSRQHCTRRNGQLDTEDLNNDQHLDTLIAAGSEQHLRYVIALGDPRYQVRTGGSVPGVGTWHLYRIPFRGDTLQIGAPNIRQIRSVRMTVATPSLARPESTVFFAMARLRLVGAPWVKRTETPIAGLSGSRGAVHGAVVASVISTENVDLGYEPPPGVTDVGQNVGDISATQINERSLRLLAVDVRPGERAEAYLRFPEGDRNLLGYRQLRVWARGRGPGWQTQEVRFFVKVGQDEHNFYLYRVPARTDSWSPEVVVDFDRWSVLRAEIERAFLQGLPPSGAAACGGDTLAYVACSPDGYLVHVRNPSISPPNLTRIQEMAVGFLRDSGSALDSVELWVDDIRLSGVVNTPGYAGNINLSILAADIASIQLNASQRDGHFRQLGENPSYTGTSNVAFLSTIRLERFGLERLGLAMPLTIRSDRTTQDPFYLNRTDVLAEGLGALRKPVATSTTYSLNLRRTRRGERWWEQAIVDNLGISALWGRGATTTELSASTSRLSDVRADYAVQPGEVSFPYLPQFLRGALEGLPGFLRNSEMVRGLLQGRFRVTPASVQLTSGLSRSSAERSSFRVPIPAAFDTVAPTVSSTALLRNSAAVGLRPMGSVTMNLTSSWTRDLRDYGDSTTIGTVAGQERERLLGLNVGFTIQRQLGTRFSWTPPLASWLRPRISWTSDFTVNRDPQSPDPERSEGDSAGAFRLPTVFSNAASSDLSTAIDVSRLLRGVASPASALIRVFDRVTQLELSRRKERRSQYNRAGIDPGADYQLGLTGLGGFLQHRGRQASAASQQVMDRFNLGVRAPLGLSATAAYVRSKGDVWFRRTESLQLLETDTRDWPNVQLRWLITPRAGTLKSILTSAQVSAGYQERTSRSRQPSLSDGAALESGQESVNRPLSMSVTWFGRVVMAVSLSSERSLAERSGNITRSGRQASAAGLTFSFKPPTEYLPIRSLIRTSMQWQNTSFDSCIERTDAGGCTSIADSRRNEYNVTMDTELPPTASAGLSVGYVLNDDRYLNRRTSQLTFALRGRITFSAGQLR